METLVKALRVFEASSAIPDLDGDDERILQAKDHSLVSVIEGLANSVLIFNSGEFNFAAIDKLWHDHQFFVSPGGRNAKNVPMARLHTKKGIIVFG